MILQKSRIVSSIMAISMTFSIFMTAVPAFAGSSLDASRVLYYSFDNGLADDLSGNGNDGTVIGATSSPGAQNAGMKFDGKDCICVDDSNSLDFKTKAFSVSFWFKDSLEGDHGYIIKKTGNTAGVQGGAGYTIYYSKGGMYLQLGSSGGYANRRFASNSVFNDGKWHHTVVTLGNNYVRAYVDGRMVTNVIHKSVYNLVNNVDLSIGGSSYASTYSTIEGSLDEMEIFNKELSEQEALSLYNKVPPIARAYWNFNGNTNDQTGNGNDIRMGGKYVEGFEGNGLLAEVGWASDGTVIFDASKLNFGKDSFAISCKFKIAPNQPNGAFICKDYGSTINSYYTAYIDEGKPTITMMDDEGNYVASHASNSVPRCDDGKWHTVVYSVDRQKQTLKVFVDGKLYADQVECYKETVIDDKTYITDLGMSSNISSLTGNITNDGRTYFGAQNFCNGCFKGVIDEMKIFDKALVLQQAIEIHNN